MRKVLVVSDTHGYLENLERVIKENRDADFLIHLGDVCNDENYIQRRVPYGVKILRGNNDWSRELADQVVIPMEGHRIFAAHGHRHNVYYGYDRMVYAAMQQGCDIVMFGHTHVPIIEEYEDCIVLNPGSLTYPRQIGRKPSYIVMDFQDDGTVECEIKYVEKE